MRSFLYYIVDISYGSWSTKSCFNFLLQFLNLTALEPKRKVYEYNVLIKPQKCKTFNLNISVFVGDQFVFDNFITLYIAYL